MRNFIIGALIASASVGALQAQETPGWIRRTALSPDGQLIAFSYKGDIYTVPTSGGRAQQITSHHAFDTTPVWSPDGQTIAFASDRNGSLDVYTTSRHGGIATRLTYNSAAERPVAITPSGEVIYEAYIRPSKEIGVFPSGDFTQLYTISLKGGRPKMYSAWTMQEPSFRDGRTLFVDYKGYEDPMRKHHTSSVTRDIWLREGENYRKLTSFKGEDRNPLWVAGEEAFYYTSEQDGTLNIYKQTLLGGSPEQITRYSKHPVRYASTDNQGNLAYSWNGDLYYLPRGGQPSKVRVEIYADNAPQDVTTQMLGFGATEMSVSPDGKEIAFVLRGDVFVTSVEYRTTKRITNTAQQERNVAFAPDGRSIVYAAERKGKWDLFLTELVRPSEKQFTYATELRERQLTDDKKPSFQPVWSPDGKEIAFLRDRSGIYVYNLSSGKEREVMNSRFNYSYSDGDQNFAWSPDGKWIVTDYIGIGGWNNKDVALVRADGSGETHNLTESGYNEGGGEFVMGGKAVAFVSDRAGYRSHGSWGSEFDIYLMFLDREAYDRFMLNKEERTILFPEKKDEAPKSEGKDEGKKKKGDKTPATKPAPALTFDFTGRDLRTVRVTRSSEFYSAYAMTRKGNKLYYIASIDGEANLYEKDFDEETTKILVPRIGSGQLVLSKDDKTLFLLSGSGLKKIEGSKVTPIGFEAPFEYKRQDERRYIFDHVVQQVEDKFYDVNLHGVDWQMYAREYRNQLPYINNNHDFAELLSELLGELNASHTGARYRAGAPATASLGVFYDDSYQGDGMRISEVMRHGPLDKAASIAKAGVIVERIDGELIKAGEPIEKYLNGKAGQRALVTLYDPSTGKRAEERIRLTSQGGESSLLYLRWVEQRTEMVKKWSDGKIAYIHIPGMNSASFRKTFKDLLGKYRHCDAVIIDTRFNGGGWLHEDLAILLTGKEFSRFSPRGVYIGSDPFAQWTKPSAVLMGEGNYSNAHGFPFVYKELGIGKLIGAPVPGTMTAVWWETQIDPSLVFGIPQVTVTDMRGKALENVQLEPDVLVYNTPEQYLRDEDNQLRTAVQELLKETKR